MSLAQIQRKITPILEEYDVSYAGVFGSVARGQETSTSDVDLLVRFKSVPGMVKYMRFVDTLEHALERKVDVVTEKSLNKRVKPYVIKDIQTVYEK